MNGARAKRAGVSIAAIALAAALLVGVNWLGARHWRHADWTKAGIHTLSSTTKKIVRGLSKPVRITVFMSRDTPLYPPVRGLLDSYRELAPNRLQIEYIDPKRNPARALAAAQELGGVREGTVVFRSEGRRKHVEQGDLAEYDFAGAQMGGTPEVKAFKGEEAFTSAIVNVTEARTPRVYFTAGHGEASIDSAERGRGLAEVKRMLERDNLVVAKWESLGKSDLPADADAVVVAGPRTAFLPPEAQALEKYLSGGGSVLLLLDPVLPRPGAPPADLGFGPLLAARNVKLGSDIVVDPANALPLMGAETVLANRFGSHAIVQALSSEGVPVVLTFARSVSTRDAPGSPAPAAAPSMLLETSPDGWGETSLTDLESELKKDPADTPGPVGLAVAVGPPETKPGPPAVRSGRLVVVGNSRFATDGALANAGNGDLVRNSVHWLTGAEKQIGIAPKTPEQASLSLTQAQVRRIGLFAILGLPAMAVVLGIWVWYRRRD